MAKVTNNLLTRGLSGAVGNAVFRQMPDGSTWVSALPNFSRRKFSKGQEAHQSRFRQAAAYARIAAKRHPIYSELTKGTTKNAYNIALSDWFNPPVIRRIGRRDGRILVEARDAVMVTRVQITILDADGGVVEKGEGIRGEGDGWEYAPSSEGKTILAEAWDLPGHATKLVLSIS